MTDIDFLDIPTLPKTNSKILPLKRPAEAEKEWRKSSKGELLVSGMKS